MTVNTKILLEAVTYGVPSGNYDGSSQDFVSDAVQAATYYLGRAGVQTVTFRVTDFSGQIVLQGTLDDSVADAHWATLYEFGESSTVAPITDFHPVGITGNFTWLRAEVLAFDQGQIDSVTVTY